MSEHLGYIDSYFNKELSVEECRIFDLRIEQDPAFAEEVAFYLNTLNTAKEELVAQKKERFREIYQEIRPAQRPGLVRRFWPHVAAAAVAITFVLRFLFMNLSTSPVKLAEDYLEEFEISTVMGISDSLAKGKELFNNHNYTESLKLFEWVILSDTTRTDVKSFAGLSCIHLGQYDKALMYFNQVENTKQQINPGKFYHALTLMKRNLPGEKEKARQLLKEVVNNDLAGKEWAQKWLKDL